MNQVSVMFDAPARSGNHLAVATLADSFPDIKFYWGYPNQHSPKSFTLPKEKAKHILTVLRNPLDSIISVVVVWKLQTKESILSAIEDNKKMLESIEHICVEGGDNKYTVIAAASILAKVARDTYIEELCKEYPQLDERYGLINNKGYGTKIHMDGIKKYGISQFHRTSFGICKTEKLNIV